MMERPPLTLLVDVGNSRVKLGWLRLKSGEREAEPLALPHAELEGLQPWLASLEGRPLAAVGVNVAGDEIAAVVEQACSVSHIPLTWLTSVPQASGIVNQYDAPTQLGADRWISLIGLSTHTEGPALLASFGTATTIDLLSGATPHSSQRRFEGGVILPGPELMRQSLAKGTARLPYAEGDITAFPRHTHAAISSGIAAAQAGAVLTQWRHAIDEFGVAPKVYCSGGGWPLVAEAVSNALARARIDLGLNADAPQWLGTPVLDGLAAMAKTMHRL